MPGVEGAEGMAKPSSANRSRFYLGSDINSLRDRVLRMGFRHAVLWYQPVVMDLLDGEEFADR